MEALKSVVTRTVRQAETVEKPIGRATLRRNLHRICSFTAIGLLAVAQGACGSPSLSNSADPEPVLDPPPVGGAPAVADDVPAVFVPEDLPPAMSEAPRPEPVTEATACVQSSVAATGVSRPVDIIFVIDNSGSMGEEIREVSSQLNTNFAPIIQAAGIDYRVNIISTFGSPGIDEDVTPPPMTADGNLLIPGNAFNSICVATPLGTTPDVDGDGVCDSVDTLPMPSERFQHFPTAISSRNGLCRLLESFDGRTESISDLVVNPDTRMVLSLRERKIDIPPLRDSLREDAFKIIVFVTDEFVDCTSGATNYRAGNAATQWVADLKAIAPEHFRDEPGGANFSVWSIVGMTPFEPTPEAPGGRPAPQTRRWPPRPYSSVVPKRRTRVLVTNVSASRPGAIATHPAKRTSPRCSS